MTYDWILRGAELALPEGRRVGDLAILGGKIAAIGDLSGDYGREELQARGLLLMPGGIDTQVHFREPGLEHKEDLESGTRAALQGGITTVFEMPNTQPTTTTKGTLEDKLERAKGRAWVHHAFFVGASTDNIAELAALEDLPGTPGIKIFMGSSTGSLLVSRDEDLREVLRNGRRRCAIHAEDEPRNTARKALLSEDPHPREHPFLRDAESARLATERILRLSAETGRHVHVLHISTRDELPLLEDGKAIGATCEITPQHLWFSAPDCYDRLGSFAQMNPPIRSSEHTEGLRRAYAEGLFAVIGSDHAPHTREEKAKPYPTSPSGMPGVQTLLPAMLTLASRGIGTVDQVVRMLTSAPSDLYGISNKGRLAVGQDADLVLVDLDADYEVLDADMQSKCGWTPYAGERFRGRVEHVFVGGVLALRDRERVGTPAGKTVEFAWKSAK
jgi:dihydroorotase